MVQERLLPASELLVQDEEGNAPEMVAVQVGDDDSVHCGRVHSPAFHRYQRRGTAVEQEVGSGETDRDARLEAPTAAEGIS